MATDNLPACDECGCPLPEDRLDYCQECADAIWDRLDQMDARRRPVVAEREQRYVVVSIHGWHYDICDKTECQDERKWIVATTTTKEAAQRICLLLNQSDATNSQKNAVERSGHALGLSGDVGE